MAKHHHMPGRRSTKSYTCHTRTLKVRQGLYSRIIKYKHHSHLDRTVHATVPWINIQGLWLGRAGFVINAPVKVRVTEGCLVLTIEA